VNTSAVSATTWTRLTDTVNEFVDGATYLALQQLAVKTGSPGALYGSMVVRYRKVAT
jgi:hypothetical protein